MQAVQREIAEQLKVQPPFADEAALKAEVARRITFIQDCLVNSGLKTLVLGISGGVDSLTAGLLAQRAMRELRERRVTIAQVHRRAPAVRNPVR
jgi:NAD+ synthase